MGPLEPTIREVDLPAGVFRTLEWPGAPTTPAVFLHGLSGVAEAWSDTVEALGDIRPRCVALDQRGHGHSPRTPGAYAATDYLDDLIALIDHLGPPVHLVGHSMGARIAILAAARRSDLLVSTTIVDIGPEAWAENITTTAGLFASLPEHFTDREEAISVGRIAGYGQAWAERFVDSRLHEQPDGTWAWLASTEALIETVTVQRARNYWRDWDRIAGPALLVRGGASDEVRPHIADRMRRRNPVVGFVELDGIGHNIPQDAPDALAAELVEFWAATAAGTGPPTARKGVIR